MGHQPGEGCFPEGQGGRRETPVTPPSRETWEEIGIPCRGHRDPGPLDVIQDISDRVIYPFLGLVSPAGGGPPGRQRGRGEERVLRPLDYLLDYPEEVYRYTVSAQVDDSFPPMNASAFPRPTPGGRVYGRAHLRVPGALYLGA